MENVHLPFGQQKEILEATFGGCKGNLEQVDDVCVVKLFEINFTFEYVRIEL